MRPMATHDPGPPGAAEMPTLQHGTTLIDVTSQRRDPAKGGTMNALARLIQRRKTELDLTWQEIADRGGFSSHTIVHALATKPVHKAPPRAETLARLAKALELPENIVRAAAFDAAGLTVEETEIPLNVMEDIRVIAAGASEMSEHDRAIVRNIVESILRQNREQRD